MRAFIVEVGIATRVILPDEFDLDEFEDTGGGAELLRQVATDKLMARLETDMLDNITMLNEDLECPYDEETDKKEEL